LVYVRSIIRAGGSPARAEEQHMADTPQEYFDVKITKKLTDNPDFASTINATYQFDLSGDNGGTWVIDLTSAPGKVSAGAVENPSCLITMTSQDFMSMVTGKLNPQMAFMTGKLRVKGNMQLALKLQKVLA
jgi:putative sterol carrier protein